MKQFATNLKETALELWNDDTGAQMVEKVLIIAAISLPILAVLLFFSGEIREWVGDNWRNITGNAGTNNDPNDSPFGNNGTGGGTGGAF